MPQLAPLQLTQDPPPQPSRILPPKVSFIPFILHYCPTRPFSQAKPREDGASRVSRRCLLINGAHTVYLTPDKSLESFIGESSETIKKVLSKYADNLAWVKPAFGLSTSNKSFHSALFLTNLQLASHSTQQVEKVSTG